MEHLLCAWHYDVWFSCIILLNPLYELIIIVSTL